MTDLEEKVRVAIIRYNMLNAMWLLAQAAQQLQETLPPPDSTIDSYYKGAIELYERYAPDHPRLAWVQQMLATFLRSDHDAVPSDAESRQRYADELEQSAMRILTTYSTAFARPGFSDVFYQEEQFPRQRRQRIIKSILPLVEHFAEDVRMGMPLEEAIRMTPQNLVTRALFDLKPFLFDRPGVAPVAHASSIAHALERVELALIEMVSERVHLDKTVYRQTAEKLLLLIVQACCHNAGYLSAEIEPDTPRD